MSGPRRPVAPPRPSRGDLALTLLFAAVVLLEQRLMRIPGDGDGSSVWWGLVAVLPLLVRRQRPGAALGAGLLLVLGPGLWHTYHPYFYGNEVTLYVLLFSWARRSGSPVARWGWLAGPVVFGVQAIGAPDARGASDLLFDSAVLGLAWVAGRTVRRLDTQGRELRRTLAAVAEEQRAARDVAVVAERSRIAVEMHDVVAHAVSLMVVQVGATRIRLEKDGRTRPGLVSVEESGREALTELRRLLGVLRQPAEASTSPLPGSSRLPELVEQYAERGLVVRLSATGVDGLPDGTGLAVYRIVQDALDDVAAQGGAAAVTVAIRREADRVVIDVTDAVPGPGRGRGAAPRRTRERVRALRGTVGAGAQHRSGVDTWQVHAVLPVEDPSALAPTQPVTSTPVTP